MSDDIILFAVGDVGPNREDPDSIFQYVKSTLKKGDLLLAYNSILPQGYWAEANRPGCAPLRGLTVYEQIEHDQPGTPSRVHTFPHKEDLAAMLEDIRKARAQADLVIVSVHWGIHFVPAVVADYQRIAARAAIDAGADLIIGHHAHILKPVEIYKDKVIIYSLANFALEEPGAFAENLDLYNSLSYKELQDLNPDWKKAPHRAMPADSYKTMMARIVISERRIQGISFLPTQIDEKANPQILQANDPRFQEIVTYLQDITRDQKIDTLYEVKGNEVFIRKP